MSDYNKKKIKPQDIIGKRLDKEQQFNKGLKELNNSKPEMVDDYRKTIAKDLPVDRIDTKQVTKVAKPSDVYEKIAAFRAAKQAGKKLAGIVPFAGAAYAAMSGDPAMAADELAGDVPVLGQAYEAFKPEVAGNVEEEREMLVEAQARKNYNASPAHLARLRALQNLK